MAKDIYVPLNAFTFARRRQDAHYITEYDAHSLGVIEYTAEELEEADDTMEVVDGIEQAIKQCGDMLAQKDWFLEYYDENGYVTEEGLEDCGGKEHTIELFCYPAVLVKQKELNNFYRNGGVSTEYGLFRQIILSYDKKMLEELFKSAYPGKAIVKMVVDPKTLIADHFNELCGKGIDVREEYIYGIVDIERLFDELKKRGIKTELSTFCLTTAYERELYECVLRGKECPPKPEPLTEVNHNTFLQNSIDTNLDGDLTVSITFGEYLRNKNKSVDGPRPSK